jgi:hypothetical protein
MTALPLDGDDPRTKRIIGCAIEGHRELGPGLWEVPYQVAMCINVGPDYQF